MSTYSYGATAVAGTDKATILQLRHRIAYLEAALADALDTTPAGQALTHPTPPTPVKRKRTIWETYPWNTPAGHAILRKEQARIHAAPTGAGRTRLAAAAAEADGWYTARSAA
ncbi:hypothetical protein [Galactobacter sp.]|uniref:hypothetical protein n=1 Tax=Galactobacter sp. TaxID=2676125 RepID=UPI0025B7DE7B|nr:hypothetical protein [Galactobacter sp.]